MEAGWCGVARAHKATHAHVHPHSNSPTHPPFKLQLIIQPFQTAPATERARRWLRLELDALQLLAYLMTKQGRPVAFQEQALRAMRRKGLKAAAEAAKVAVAGAAAAGEGAGGSGSGSGAGGEGLGDGAGDEEAVEASLVEVSVHSFRVRLGVGGECEGPQQ